MTTETLPPLTGSEKQVAWATEIRDGALADLELVERMDASRPSMGEPADTKFAQRMTLRPAAIAFLRDVYASRTDARWWIDNRTNLVTFRGYETPASAHGLMDGTGPLPQLRDSIASFRRWEAEGHGWPL